MYYICTYTKSCVCIYANYKTICNIYNTLLCIVIRIIIQYKCILNIIKYHVVFWIHVFSSGISPFSGVRSAVSPPKCRSVDGFGINLGESQNSSTQNPVHVVKRNAFFLRKKIPVDTSPSTTRDLGLMTHGSCTHGL